MRADGRDWLGRQFPEPPLACVQFGVCHPNPLQGFVAVAFCLEAAAAADAPEEHVL